MNIYKIIMYASFIDECALAFRDQESSNGARLFVRSLGKSLAKLFMRLIGL
jgi:hypothetical protein